MDYNSLVIFPNEKKIIEKINSCKELAHRMDHSNPKFNSILFRYKIRHKHKSILNGTYHTNTLNHIE